MEISQDRTVKIVAIMLLLAAIMQPIYTALFQFAPDVDRSILWGLEGLLFTLLAAFAGSALVMAKRYTLGFSAIAFSAVFNLVQVAIGFTQFGPFGDVARANPELAPLIGAVVAFSFFIYNAAKILLGLAAIVFGMAKMNAGGKALGGLTTLVGVAAFVTNTILVVLGREGFLSPHVAGGTGVAATLLLGLCLLSLKNED